MRIAPVRAVGMLLISLSAIGLMSCAERTPTEVVLESPLFHGDEDHSHGRFASLTWAPVAGVANMAEFTYKVSFRHSVNYPCWTLVGGNWSSTPCSGPGGRTAVGDIFTDNLGGNAPLRFGDGNTIVPRFKVTTVNLSEDWLFAEAVDHFTGVDKIRHQYSGIGPYIAYSSTCCRVGGLRNSGSQYGASTQVYLGDGNRSPVSNMVPVLSVAEGGIRYWTIPASDPDGDRLRFSLPVPSAIPPGNVLDGVQPAGMTIDSNTGVVTWNTSGRPTGLYFSIVMIEDLDASGNRKSFILVDYLVNVQVGSPNIPPSFTSPAFCGGSTTFMAGTPGSFTVTAIDPDGGDVVTLAAAGIPSGAGFISGAPGNPVSGEFSWTPTAAQGGPTIITFSATDQNLGQGVCNVTVNVQTRQPPAGFCPVNGPIGGIDLGNIPEYLFFFSNGSSDANWQSSSKGYVGNVAINGVQARHRSSGSFGYAGTIFTNDQTLGGWQRILNNNPTQASAVFGESLRISRLEDDLTSALAQIDALSATAGYESRSARSLNDVDTQNGIAERIVINVTSDFSVSSKINITGDAEDVFILRWDMDADPANGYQGQVKFQSGGAIVPLGGLTAGNFIHVAGDINASGGGANPAAPYPQGPRYDDGQGALIDGGSDFSGGGFFTGYWLTTGSPSKGETASMSNAIFVGGWYSTTGKFSMTSGTSGVHVCPNPQAIR
jgi:hypothetical protein